MADVKISALPVATTPLAGTEVLPIVQGGTTDKVSVANLTAGRTVDGAAFTASGTVSGTTVVVGAGTVSAPSVTFSGDTNTGIYSPAADTIAFTEGGVEAMRINSSAQVEFSSGTVSLPSITATGDLNTGIFFPAADTVAIVEGGTEALRINSDGQTVFTAGTVSLPSITTTGDLNTGIFFPAADTVALVTNGTEDFRVGPAGQFGIGGANYGTSGQVLTSNGAAAAPSWQAAGGSGFPAGTAMLFVQTSAPTGWTKSATHNDKALRVVSGGASSGGSVAFTTAFASQAVNGTVGSTTLSTSQIPSHSHQLGGQGAGTQSGASQTILNTLCGTGSSLTRSANEGGGGSHNHSFSGTAINLAVQYVDVIIATKD